MTRQVITFEVPVRTGILIGYATLGVLGVVESLYLGSTVGATLSTVMGIAPPIGFALWRRSFAKELRRNDDREITVVLFSGAEFPLQRGRGTLDVVATRSIRYARLRLEAGGRVRFRVRDEGQLAELQQQLGVTAGPPRESKRWRPVP